MPTVETEEFLAHHGVLGMKWGRRKVDTPEKAKRETSNFKEAFGVGKKKKDRTENQQLNRELLGSSVALGAAVATKLGIAYVIKHPEVLSRATNTIKGTKAIDVGYDVVKMGLKNGRYVLR